MNNKYTIENLLKQEGLDWGVETKHLFMNMADQPELAVKPVTSHKAVVRTDTGAQLGIVGAGYKEVSNIEAFKPFDAALEKLGGGLTVENAGQFKGGQRVFVQVRLPNDTIVKGFDKSHNYALIATSHDGSSGISGLTTSVRVVCSNTLNTALRTSKNKVSVRHSTNALINMGRITEFFTDCIETTKLYEGVANILANRQANSAIVDDVLGKLGFSVMKANGEKAAARTLNAREAIIDKFTGGLGNTDPRIKGSLWALLNGVTEWSDHHRATRGSNAESRNDNARFSKMLGSGATLKTRALQAVLEVA